jgi:hypothetical protein
MGADPPRAESRETSEPRAHEQMAGTEGAQGRASMMILEG